MVEVNVEDRTIREEIYEDVWEERERRLIIVLDVSPSVFPGENPWMEPVWKGLVLSMVDKTEHAEASIILHKFDGGDRGWNTATTKGGYTKLRQHVSEITEGSGTDIGSAVRRTMNHLEADTYDQAEIMLVTDGQDFGGINPAEIRRQLETSRIKLHVILLGVTHQSLLACADTYQIVENTNDGPVVRGRVTRQ